jgi:hypothetical protein
MVIAAADVKPAVTGTDIKSITNPGKSTTCTILIILSYEYSVFIVYCTWEYRHILSTHFVLNKDGVAIIGQNTGTIIACQNHETGQMISLVIL